MSSNYTAVNAKLPHMCTANVSLLSTVMNTTIQLTRMASVVGKICHRSCPLFDPFSETAGYATVISCINDPAHIQSERNYFLCMSEWFVVEV
jgi:hypothetical protein